MDEGKSGVWSRGFLNFLSEQTILKIFEKNLSFYTNPRSVSQTVYKIQPVKVKHNFVKMPLFQGDCKSKFGKGFIQTTNAISKRYEIEIPDWRQMKEFWKGYLPFFLFYLVLLSSNGLINRIKARPFLKFHIVNATF